MKRCLSLRWLVSPSIAADPAGRVEVTRGVLALSTLLALFAGPCLAQTPPRPVEFAWRAQLELPVGTSLARVSLPAQALLQLQSSDARDVRVFNAAGEPVPFAFAAQPLVAPATQRTRSYSAHPLYHPAPGAAPGKGSVQVRVGDADQARSVWVQINGARANTGTGTGTDSAAMPPAATRLNAAIFATQAEKQQVTSLTVQAQLPANAPVRVSASTSADLAQWTAVPLRGRLYRFDGAPGLVNDTLELEQPLALEGRYLRLEWEGQEGVSVSSITGVVAAPAMAQRVRAALAPPVTQADAGLEWPLTFRAPIAALALSTPLTNSLLPVRILGRSEAAAPWRELGRTVVYRLGSGAGETTNPPLLLPGASVRWLRVEATQGMPLGRQALAASVEFTPLQLVFLASGSGPFELAAGRPDTAAASLAAGVLAAAAPGKFEDLPKARIGAVAVRPVAAPGVLSRLWPGGPGERTLWL